MSFVLVDCNNFYVSCERLFNPRLEGRPVIVLSNNDGCVVARSQEAKRLNIKMGAPFFQIKDLCKQRDVVVYSSNYALYGDISRRVMNILSERAPEIQIYSIDEAFLKYPSSISPEALFTQCAEMRQAIKKWVGIPTSIGIAPTKTLAKIAGDFAKKDSAGVFSLHSKEIQDRILEAFPVEEIWGIGRNLAAKLHVLGIYTAQQLRDAEPAMIRKKMGVVGERIVWELRGVSCLSLEKVKPKQSITCSRSFGRAIEDPLDLAEALASFVNTACIKVRRQKSGAQALCVFLEAGEVQAGRRQVYSTAVSFAMPTNDTSQIISAAKRCLASLFYKGLRYKKCGVILMDLIPMEDILPDLFLGSPDPKRERLMHLVDSVNARFGKDALFYAAMGVKQHWRARSSNRTRQYTTNWDDLALAKA